jgi:hypothetical protein
VLFFSTGCSVLGIRTVEEAGYSVLREDGRFELRQYDDLVVAQTSVNASFDKAGEIAFGRLFGYISGENVARSEISMTAPVLTEPQGESEGVKVAMTAPVLAEGTGNAWKIAFVLPSSFTMDTAPVPSNPLVELATIPSKTVAVVRFSGSLSERKSREAERELLTWMERSALTPASASRSAGYDPPWTPSFLRRNEVLIDVEEKLELESSSS